MTEVAKREHRRAARVPGAARAVDTAFFVFGGLAAVWLATLLLQESLQWRMIWFSLVFWAVLAYLVLPRLHRILTRVYLPDYFIGRARTSDGLLGDPVNVALLGTEEQLHAAMRRAGWTRADEVDLGSSWRIIQSTLTKRSYHEAPVSPLFVFGRQQDVAYQQEVDGNPGKRHHIRFWRCPPGWVLPGGARVDWVAAGTYDRSVGLSLFTLQITHKIEEDIDKERDYVLASIRGAEPDVEIRVIRDFATGYHSRNGGGDTISTDGHLPVVDLRRVSADPADRAPEPTDSRDKRPAPTTFGAVLVFCRGLVSLAFAAALATDGSALGTAVAEQGARSLLPAVAAAVAAFGLTELAMAWFIYRGGNRARVATMSLSALAIIVQFVNVLSGGPGISFATNLVGLALDILLILALSSERARTYAHRRDTLTATG